MKNKKKNTSPFVHGRVLVLQISPSDRAYFCEAMGAYGMKCGQDFHLVETLKDAERMLLKHKTQLLITPKFAAADRFDEYVGPLKRKNTGLKVGLYTFKHEDQPGTVDFIFRKQDGTTEHELAEFIKKFHLDHIGK